MSENVLSVFFSRSFIVSCLIFNSVSHFEFIFVYSIRECPNFIYLHEVVQFSQHHLLKRLSFFHCMALPPLSKSKKKKVSMLRQKYRPVEQGRNPRDKPIHL